MVYAETARFELAKGVNPCLVSSEVPSTNSATSPNGLYSNTLHYCFLMIKDILTSIKYLIIYMKGFLEFIRSQGVVGLAVGFILGGAISDLVKSIVTNIINPILQVLLSVFGSIQNASFTIYGATIEYGVFIGACVNFIIIACVVYFGVKKLGLDKLDKKD